MLVEGFSAFILVAGILVFLGGIRIVRPTERALIERLGKYHAFAHSGFNWVIPIIDRVVTVNITEKMYAVDKQEIITEDNLNANVDLVIFYKVREDEDSVKRSVYKVSNFNSQITALAQTTARNVIGGMPFKDVNSKRNVLNVQLLEILQKETKAWGVDIVRVELRDITPPTDVQDTMNKVIKAENEKRAAVDFATAMETQADGKKRASVKEAEGIAQSKKIVADAEAYKIKIVNESAEKYFKGNAQKMKQMEVTQASLQSNSKIILTEKGINPQLLIGNLPVSDDK